MEKLLFWGGVNFEVIKIPVTPVYIYSTGIKEGSSFQWYLYTHNPEIYY